jgi:hypothetical protein
MSHVYSEKQLDHYLAIMDRVAELWLQKFPERAAYSPGYWHLFMGLYKNRKRYCSACGSSVSREE